jgi:hypothetical protein
VKLKKRVDSHQPTLRAAQRPFRRAVPKGLEAKVSDINAIVRQFIEECEPAEQPLHVFVDARTLAQYCECHLRAETILSLGTIDVPLDPEEQPEYRANRQVVEDHVAYEQMKDDARAHRTFSNIVAEFTTGFDPKHPLKIIGGQHRFNAIAEAFKAGVNELHGLKVYFALNADQRFDVQLISNTNIAASTDLFDRMHETLSGPDLREWCQTCGLLESAEDFADKRRRGHAITVRAARTFILNYFRGKAVDSDKFDVSDTTPLVCKTGVPDPEWEKLRIAQPQLWKDKKLEEAGIEFARLVEAQRNGFTGTKVNVDYAEKALNMAVMSAWAYVAGLLHSNEVRRKRHFALADTTGKNPLNAAALAKGRHKTDPDNYRGLGYRVDPKERGRFVELFYLQAEKGSGINNGLIDLAIKKYHAKQAVLEVQKAEEKGE